MCPRKVARANLTWTVKIVQYNNNRNAGRPADDGSVPRTCDTRRTREKTSARIKYRCRIFVASTERRRKKHEFIILLYNNVVYVISIYHAR